MNVRTDTAPATLALSAAPASRPQRRAAKPSPAAMRRQRKARARRSPRLSRLLAWLLSALLGSGAALAQVGVNTLPAGGLVVTGSGQLVYSPNLLVVNQGTQRLSLDWQSFNIGSGATVEFRQPGSDSVALNRVLGHSGSQIYGQLRANGQVFLVNPHGVLFAPGAKVDVGGLVASTLDLSHDDFAAGRYIFSGNATGGGRVSNQGSLKGAAGGYVALFGRDVDNQGEISVPRGSVVLASGRAATVSISGSGLISAVVSPGTEAGSVANGGSVTADGGRITLSAASAEGIASSLVNNSGIVRANSIEERNGEIWITGDQVVHSGQASADATGRADAGRVMILGDLQRGGVAMSGSVSATAEQGRGGEVETSAAQVRIAPSARVTTLSQAGAHGRWLIDPTDFTIAAGNAAQTDSGIGVDTLATNLNAGNVAIATVATGTGNGDIFVNAALNWTADTNLTLTAHRNVVVNENITASGLGASLSLDPGTGGSFTLASGRRITLSGSQAAFSLDGQAYTAIRTYAQLQALDTTSALAGRYVLLTDLDASASATANSGAGFNPIGSEGSTTPSGTTAFTGTFQGLGNTITGLTVNRPTAVSAGLFAMTSGATVENLRIEGSVTGGRFVGAVAGLASGATALRNVSSAVTVVGDDTQASNFGVWAGGLLGQVSSGSAAVLSRVSATGSVTASPVSGAAGRAGGLVGEMASGTVATASASGNVTVTPRNGSSASNVLVGGLIGSFSGTSVSGATATGQVSGGGEAGGLIGRFAPTTSGTLTGGRAEGSVSGAGSVGGLVGVATGTGSISDSDALGDVSTTGPEGVRNDAGGAVGRYAMTQAPSDLTAAGNVSGGDTTGGLIGYLNVSSANMALPAGSLVSVVPVGTTKTVTGPRWAGGIIGYSETSGAISGLSFVGNVTATGVVGSAGGLVGRTQGAVSNSSSQGSVSGGADAGGLVGRAEGSQALSGVSSTASVTSTTSTSARTGGLIGWLSNGAGGLSGGSASGTVTSTGVAGGLVGSSDSTGAIADSNATGASVSGVSYVGGLVGYQGSGAITGSSAAANVTGVSYVGGLAGRTGGAVSGSSATGSVTSTSVSGTVYIGGLVGSAEGTGNVTNGTASGAVSAVSTGSVSAGGLVGYMTSGSLVGGLATGNVSGAFYGGGAVGYFSNFNGAVIDGTEARGNVSSRADAGGIVGYATGNGSMVNVVASGNVSSSIAVSYSAGGAAGYFNLSGGMVGVDVAGTVSGGFYTGGVVGYYDSVGALTNNSASAATRVRTTATGVSGSGYVGGIVGYNDTAAISGFAVGLAVTASTSNAVAGGLAGRTGGAVSNSSSSGAVTSAGSAGGLIGRAEGSGALSGLSATGNVSSSGGSYVGGLAGWVTGTGDVSGVSASGSVSAAGNYVGGLFGYYTRDNLSTASATGAVSGQNYVGGAVGQFEAGGTSNAVQATGSVTATGSYAGGLYGYWNSSGDIVDSQASGAVRGNNYVGGLVGYGYGYIDNATNRNIINSSASGRVDARGTYAGGLAGSLDYVSISRGTASGRVAVSAESFVYVGGLVGYWQTQNNGSLADSRATGEVWVDARGSYTGGLVGYGYGGAIIGSEATGNVTAIDSLGSSIATGGGLVGYYTPTGTNSIRSSNAGGAVFVEGTAGGLVGQASASGAGQALTDVTATGSVTGTRSVGGLVGVLTSTGVVNGQASGHVLTTDPNSYASGGLIGEYSPFYAGSVIQGSRASGSVQGGYQAGGLVGSFQGAFSPQGAIGIVDSHASGNVSNAFLAGGLVGQFNSSGSSSGQVVDQGIRDSSASGTVAGRVWAGGLVGLMTSYTGIVGSRATGDVTVGVASGVQQSNQLYAGGLVGQFVAANNTNLGAGVIAESYAFGDVRLNAGANPSSSLTARAGGLAGYVDSPTTTLVTVRDSYATGDVTFQTTLGTIRAGGLIGETDSSVTRTYATGAVLATGNTTTRRAGGLVGQRQTTTVTVTDSYWATDLSGLATSDGGTATTGAGLRTAATFANWSLATAGGSSNVWRIYDGLSTPLLRRFLTPLSVTLADVTKVYDGTTGLAAGAINVGGTAVTQPERILGASTSPNAGTYTLGAANLYSVQDGYDLSVTGSATLTIERRALTLTGLVANKVYDGTTTATLAATPTFGNLVAGEDLVFQAGNGFGANFDTRNVGTGKTVTLSGSYSIGNGSNGLASNYLAPSTLTTTANITPKPVTVGSFTAVDRAYDGTTTVAVNATAATVSGIVAGDAVTVDVAAVTSGTVASRNVGTAKPVTLQGAVLTGADAGNYTVAGSDAVTVNITPRTLTVNGILAPDRTYNRSTQVNLDFSSAVFSGLVTGDDVLLRTTNVGSQMADKNVGTGKPVTVTGLALRGFDAANYTAVPGSVTVNVTPYPLTINYFATTASSKVYDGTNTSQATLSTTWYSGDDITVTNTGITFSDKNVAYNGSGAVTSKTVTVSGIAISGADAANYALQNTTDTLSATISPRPLAVSGVTAVNRAYDGTRDVTVNISGATVDTTSVVAGDNVAVATPGSGTVTGQVANKNVGNNKAVTVPGLTLTGTDAGNYTITSGSGGGVVVNITPKPLTAVYTAQNKVYNGNEYAPMVVTSGDIVAGDDVRFYIDVNYCGVNACGYAVFMAGNTAPDNTTPSRHVGNAKPVVISGNFLVGGDASNYTLLNPTGTSSANITPKPVTLSFTGDPKVYDGTTGATVTLNFFGSGLFGNDTVSSTQTAVYTGTGAKNVGTNKPIAVSDIVLSGADAGNYSVGNATATTTGNVTAKPVTVTGISATDRPYDGTVNVAVAATGSVGSAGFVAGDIVAVTLPPGGLSTGTIANPDVGNDKPVTVTGLGLSGADAANYRIDSTASGITVDITPKALTPTYAGVNRVYNGGVSVSVTPTTAGIVAGDAVTWTQTAVFTGANAKDVGTAKPVSVTNIALSGADASNYTLALTTASTTADVTPKPVTVSYVGSSRVYSGLGNLAAAVVGTSLQLVAGDNVGFAQTALFADGAAGTNKPVTITNISLTGAQAGNYTLQNTTASTTATVTPRPLGVTGVSATGKVYDGTTTVSVNVANASVDTSAVIAGDQVAVVLPGSGISTGDTADRHVGANKPVTITGLTLTGAQAANYALVGATGLTASITPRPVTASYSAGSKVYDGTADAAVTGTSSGFLAVDAGLVGISAQGLFTAGKNVGTGLEVTVYDAFLTGAVRDNYTLGNPSGTATGDITPRTVTASFSGLSRVYDGTTAALVSSSLANRVSGDSLGTTQTAVFTGTGARNAGSGKPIAVSGVTLTGSDAGNYVLASTTGTATGTITPKPITVSGLSNVVASDRVYDGTTTVTVTVPSGVTLVPDSSDIVAGDQVTVNLPVSGVTTGTMADKRVGAGKPVTVSGLTLSGTDAANYSIAGTAGITVSITPRPITATYAGVNRVYDGSVLVQATGSSAGVIGGDSLLIRGSGSFTDGKNVGTAKPVTITTASLSGADAVNYTLLNTTGSTTADVTPRPVTPSYTGGSRVYDGSTSAPVTAGSLGFVFGDAVSLTQTAVFTGAGAKNVGTGKPISVSNAALQGADAGNYVLTSTSGTASGSITPRPVTLTGLTGVTATNREYDGTTSVQVQVQASGTVAVNPADIVSGDDVGVAALSGSLTSGTVASKNVGNAKPVTVTGLQLTGTDAANYSVAATQGLTVDITPRPVTASYSAADKVYDGTAAAVIGGTAAGLVAGDTVTVGGSGVFAAGRNVGTGLQVNVTAGALTGADAANYRLTNATGSATASITPRAVTATFTGGTRVYDGTVLAPVTGTVVGLITGDTVTLAQSATFTGAGARNVGTDKPVSVSGLSLGGTDAGNYTLTTSSASTTASITPRPLGIIGLTGVSATDRTYDGTTQVVVNVLTSGTVVANPNDLIAGDVVTITAPPTGTTTGTMTDKHVGQNKPVAVAGLTIGGADAANYTVATTSGVTVNIAPRPVTASYGSASRAYDGTTAATVTGTSADFIAGDTVGVTGTGQFTGSGARNVGTGKTVQITAAQLTGADAANYVLANPAATTTADITPRVLTVNALGGTREYDGTTTAPVTSTLGNVVAGDVVSVSQQAVFTGTGARNVGNNKPVQVFNLALSGADAANYALAGTSLLTTASITPRSLNVTGLTGISAVDRVYDGTLAVQVNVSGAVGSGSIAVIAGDDVQLNVPGSGPGAAVMLDKHAGANKPVVLSGLFLSGTDAGNYRIAGTAGVTVNIAPAPLSIGGVSARDRAYDGTTVVAIDTAGGTLTGVLAGDDVSLPASGVSGALADKAAGTARSVTVSGLTLAGADARNYVASGGSGLTVNITPRTLNATLTVADRVYDGTTGAQVTLSDDRVAGDQLSLVLGSPAAFATRNAGTGIAVSAGGASLAGPDAANYRLASDTLAGSGTILPAPLRVSADSLSKLYGDTATLTYRTTGLVQGETLGTVALSSAGAAAGAAVTGSPYTVSVGDFTGGTYLASNYVVTRVDGQLVVQPRPLVVGTESLVRYQGEPNPANGFAISVPAGALVNGDALLLPQYVPPPAGSATAGAGSVYELAPDPASLRFSQGSAANYAITTSPGLLVVLPRPPQVGDGGNAGSGDALAVTISPEDEARAQAEIGRTGGLLARATRPAGLQLPAAQRPPTSLPPELMQLLGGDGRRLNTRDLQGLPLIVFDPELLRLMGAAPEPNGAR